MNYRLKKILKEKYKTLPTLETERLILRPLNENDVDDFYEYAKNPIVSKYVFWYPMQNREDAESYIKRLIMLYDSYEYFEFAVELKENHKMIGTCGFTGFSLFSNTADIGYSFSDDYWNRGICTEALTKVLEFAFNSLCLDTLTASYIEGNDASEHILKKFGFMPYKTRKIAFKNTFSTIHYLKINKGNFISK